MILLDTNIVSEMMKPLPNPYVVKWLDQQDAVHLFVSTITMAEICYGISALPEGHRQRTLEEAFNKAIVEAFEGRILTFDVAAAYAYGKIMAQRRLIGQPLGSRSAEIAAIASVHGSAVATRNVPDFTNCNVVVINPFAEIA